MGCTSPLYRIPLGCSSVCALNYEELRRAKNGGVLFFDYDYVLSLKARPGINEDDIQVLPCGQCRSCRLARSKEWAIRLSLEAERHDHNYFVTLTYDDYHLPRGEFVDYSGDVWESNLCKSDVQKFLKKLRKFEVSQGNVDDVGRCKVRVFYCGEYGDQNGRPHYHLILMGCTNIPDLVYNFTKGKYKYYKSPLYEGFWSEGREGCPRGFVDITEASFDNMAYTARYVMKKIGGQAAKEFREIYESMDPELRPDVRLQPFVNMSLNPAIALDYYVENRLAIREEDLVKYQKKYKLFKSRPPRYFDKLFESEDLKGYKALKERRKRAGIASKRFRATRFSESERSRMLREDQMLKSKMEKCYVRSL